MKENNPGAESFQNFAPDRVVELIDAQAYDYLCTNEEIPQDKRDFFNLLHEVRSNAATIVKQNGASHGKG